jgi:hypothetical protein
VPIHLEMPLESSIRYQKEFQDLGMSIVPRLVLPLGFALPICLSFTKFSKRFSPALPPLTGIIPRPSSPRQDVSSSTPCARRRGQMAPADLNESTGAASRAAPYEALKLIRDELRLRQLLQQLCLFMKELARSPAPPAALTRPPRARNLPFRVLRGRAGLFSAPFSREPTPALLYIGRDSCSLLPCPLAKPRPGPDELCSFHWQATHSADVCHQRRLLFSAVFSDVFSDVLPTYFRRTSDVLPTIFSPFSPFSFFLLRWPA